MKHHVCLVYGFKSCRYFAYPLLVVMLIFFISSHKHLFAPSAVDTLRTMRVASLTPAVGFSVHFV